MLGHVFSHNLIKLYTGLFGSYFSDIYINRYTRTGDVEQTIKVPISYGPKEKYLTRLESDPDLKKPVAITLPRLTFQYISIGYAPERKLNTMGKFTKTSQNKEKQIVYNPVPYDIYYQLSVLTKNVEDGTNIIEQILPFFTPDYTNSIKILPEMDITTDIPLTLINISNEDIYEGSFERLRHVEWILTFKMKCWLFGPVKEAKIIKKSTIDLINLADNIFMESVSAQPGLTAQGTPTSKLTDSIPYTDISPDDDYGYIIEKSNE